MIKEEKIGVQIKRDSRNGAKERNACRFRRDRAALKYVERIAKNGKFVFTKRTIKELSPWSLRMVKTILKKDVVDVKSGLQEILKNGASADDIKRAFQYSAIFNRLAEMKY